MTQPLLTTKFFFPRARTNLVSRPRLIEQLSAGLHRPLTLISAPAGYGKTTLLSDWRLRSGSEYPVAWLSLDPGDDNLPRFLTYVSAALETIDARLSQDLVAQLHSPLLPPVDSLITAIINSANTFPDDFALILDDCHFITDPSIHAALAYLLDHPPPKMHLVMLTRADPPIHLAKLRARGDMLELRANDLRFTSQEAALFLNTVMDLKLSAENVDALDQRTEGWVVGLQMAALSMLGNRDGDDFIKAFTGSNRYILDFLSEEVIQRQPKSIQMFLLQTSVLDSLTGPLCDAVMGGSYDSAQVLAELERRNLFLIPLDDERQWYRYHHLFSSLLFQSLKQTQPEIVSELYERAAAWLEANGYLESAIGCALKAQDYDVATRLLLQIKNSLWNRGEVHKLLNWLNTLPGELVRSQPELCIAYAGCLVLLGYFDAAEKWLQSVEAFLAPISEPTPETALWTQKILIYRSVIARAHGDFPTAIALAQSGLDRTPDSAVRDRGSALLFLSHAHFYAGNTRIAEQVLLDTIKTTQSIGHISACLNARHFLAQLKILQGRLHEAYEIYEQAIAYVKEIGVPVYSGVEYAGLGDLKREWNQLEAATGDIQTGLKLAEAGDFIFFLTEVYPARIRLAISQKDWPAAQSFIQKAEQVARRCPTSIEIKRLQALQAWLQLAQGNIAEAGAWAGTVEAELKRAGIDEPIDPQHEFILLTLAHVWLAQGKSDEAALLLEHLRSGSEAAGRHGHALEAQMLQAFAEQAAGNDQQAIDTFTQALARAAPEDYTRLFIEAGEPTVKLLYQATRQATPQLREYARNLLAAYFREHPERPEHLAESLPGAMPIEPLSKREMEVLRLIANGSSNKEIAAQLVISTGTVKRHVVHIFQKLGAGNRTQAVSIARELGIISQLSR